jgi:hypothetical protein
MAAWRALRPAERLEVALRLSDDGMALTVAGIRSRQPNLNDQGVITELHRIPGNGELAR